MADKYRFYAIAEANKEITRLEALVAERDTTLTAAQERISALEKVNSDPSAELIQSRADLGTARQTIGTLESRVKTLEADAVTIKADADKAKAGAAKQASIKAAEITAGQGQPPIAANPTSTPANTKASDVSKLKGLEKAIAAHKAAYESAK